MMLSLPGLDLEIHAYQYITPKQEKNAADVMGFAAINLCTRLLYVVVILYKETSENWIHLEIEGTFWSKMVSFYYLYRKKSIVTQSIWIISVWTHLCLVQGVKCPINSYKFLYLEGCPINSYIFLYLEGCPINSYNWG